jgi:hypothetical protein
MGKILVLQLLAHLISDFIFQSPKSTYSKAKKGFRSIHQYLHMLIVFVFSWIFSFSIDFLLFALLIACSHLLVDLSKSCVKKILAQNSQSYAVKAATLRFAFIIDQLLHLLFIYFFVYLYVAKTATIPALITQIPANILLIVTAFFICLKPSNVFIQTILNSYSIMPSNASLRKNRDLENAGRLIGNIERCITLIFTILGQFSAIGFIIAAKTILRYKEGDVMKTEYVLIGTLLSFGIAVVLGIVIRERILLPYL